MTNKQEIINEIERLISFKDIMQSYEEIAASRMRLIRDSVLKTRDFLSGINQVFHDVQASYKEEITKLMKDKKIKDPSKITFLRKNSKTVFVLLSANTGLYGDIIQRTFALFVEHLKKENCDAVIIGKLGSVLIKNEKLKNSITYFDLQDNTIDPEVFRKIMDNILQYEKIIVFHGQFQTIITQKPVISNLSGTYTITTQEQSSSKLVNQDQTMKQNNIKYLFEPSLEKTMEFFEKEIFSSIFEQTLHESQLAKFSSRMVVLNSAVENITGKLKNVEYERRKLKHRSGNRKQLSRISSMSLWKI